MQRLPISLQSLLIQCAACVMAAFLFWAGGKLAGWGGTVWVWVLVQGGLAAAFSRILGQPVWWHALHMTFLPAVWLALHLDLPPWTYLLGFGVLLLFYWSTSRTRVPLFLSGARARGALAELLPTDRPFRFIDLGSGMGGVPLTLAKRFPLGRFEGTEIAPAPWFIGWLRSLGMKGRVRLLRRDYTTLDLGAYDVVFAFLSPAAMPALWTQARAQMQAGSLLVSLAFDVPGQPADQTIQSAEGARHILHVWEMGTRK